MIIGADISFYQDNNGTPQGVDFQAMADNAAFIIIRAGQNNWIDSDFKSNWQNAKSILPRGSYWFYDSRADPKKQAQLWIDTMDGDFGELPLWCDFEDRYGGMFGTWRHWYDFIEEMKRLCNHPIGIYTGYYYWTERTTGIPKASLDYFRQYPLWIAAYNTAAPKVPAPWYDWSLWQFTDNGDGTLYGVESLNIDLNYVSESFAKLYQLKRQEQEKNEMTSYEMTPIYNGTRLRDDHNTFAAVITSYNNNHTIRGSELWEASVDGAEVKKGDKWLYVTHVNGNELLKKGWMAYIHKGQSICDNFKIIGNVPTEPEIPMSSIDADINIVIENGIITSVVVNGEQWKK